MDTKKFSVQSDVFHQAVMWHGLDHLPRLRSMTFDQRKAVMEEALKINLENPLHMSGPKPQFVVSSWSDKPMSGAQVVALMVFGLWVQVGESEDLASGLLADWPEIKQALALEQKGE